MSNWNERKVEWVAKLRSGDVSQGHNSLVVEDRNDDDDGYVYSYCCLGVFAGLDCNFDEAGIAERADSEGTFLDIDFAITVGFPDDRHEQVLDYVREHYSDHRLVSIERGYEATTDKSTQNMLASLNDGGFSFMEIADIVENVL